MVMRSAPVPAAKGLYIMLDTLREAEHIGAHFGNMYDPVARAVERGPEDEPDLCVWGRDRLWLVAAEIRRRLGAVGPVR
jgi:2-hydroxychromene-2-carboxylate isomerase